MPALEETLATLILRNERELSTARRLKALGHTPEPFRRLILCLFRISFSKQRKKKVVFLPSFKHQKDCRSDVEGVRYSFNLGFPYSIPVPAHSARNEHVYSRTQRKQTVARLCFLVCLLKWNGFPKKLHV